MSEPDQHRIGSSQVTATVASAGAELHSVQTASGRELLWQAGPQWPRHAPVLFPIVGRLTQDRLLHEGVATRMTQHGFARDRAFRSLARGPARTTLVLEDDDQSRRIYPFAFRLEIEYRIEAATLTVGYTLSNPSTEPLPASLGAHPAFVWPLDPAMPATKHEIVFEQDETAPIRRVEAGLLRPEAEPTPINGRTLLLDPALFENDAVILDAVRSRSLRYGIPGGAGLTVAWSGFTQLGLWSKPGADFLCIEPWSGLASPTDFDGEFSTKPYLLHIPPGASHTASWSVTPDAIP